MWELLPPPQADKQSDGAPRQQDFANVSLLLLPPQCIIYAPSKWVSAAEILLGNVCISTLSTFLNLLKSPSAKSNIATAKLLFSLVVHIVLVLSFSYHAKWSDVLLWKVSLQQCSILNDSNRRSVRSKMLPITIFGDGGRGVDLRLGFVRWSAPWRFPSITAAGQNCKSNGNFGSKSLFLRQNWKCRGRLRGVFYAGQSRIDLTCRQK